MLEQLLSLLKDSFSNVFAQGRSQYRAIELALGTLCALGRRTISRSICAVGRQNQDWSADYKLYSRSSWQASSLFDPVLKEYLQRYRKGPVVMAFDDTKLPKTGRRIKSAFWQKDPLSPPFHTNLLYGLRFMQVSLIFPHYNEGPFLARAIPVRFEECPAVKKPGKRATEEELQSYRKAIKTQNLPTQSLQLMTQLRKHLDDLGEVQRPLLLALDGSLCNKTIFRAPMERIELVARCRKDARLCLPAPEGTRRKYGTERFSPEQVRQNEEIFWETANIFFGGSWRTIRFKQMKNVLWQRGSGTRKLRLFVVSPQPYKVSPRSRTNYRAPAYLLSTDSSTDATTILQAYFDRWQIEVNHREEKNTLGIGQAQVWSPKSVPRQPTFAVATYSLLLLSGLRQFGPGRTEDFITLPKWRKKANRPSALDLITLLRKEIKETSVSDLLRQRLAENLVSYANA